MGRKKWRVMKMVGKIPQEDTATSTCECVEQIKTAEDHYNDSLRAGSPPSQQNLYPLDTPPEHGEPRAWYHGRIVLLTCDIVGGGAETQTVILARELASLGFEIVVINVGPHRDNPFIGETRLSYSEERNPEIVKSADAVIWWGNCLKYFEGCECLPNSVYVIHSCSRQMEKLLLVCKPWISHLVGVSGPAAELGRRVLGLPASVIWNGVYSPGERLGTIREPGSPLIVGCLGRYVVEKNIFAALLALPLLPDNVRLRFYGSGPLREDLLYCAQLLHVDNRVDIGGYVSTEQALSEFDALLLPSVFEGHPLVVCEAMLAGVPVIATPQGDLPLICREGERGIMVRPNPRSIAAGIMRCYDWPYQAGWLADNAREFATEYLTAQIMGINYAQMICKITEVASE